ncbi:MAG TPA: SGNH/GDSL hydrolase family protein, partial [Devosia sp.]|nr:SGNH/GDSL hydrolase family protein [Devosia sp.]
MKTILAFGDSLTFGANPQPNGPRHAYADRWPTALEQGLGGAARVIAEGLGGRTTVSDDWYAAADRNGARILPTLLESHSPLDLVIIMLGTNDLKPAICGSALEASFGMRRLVQIIRGHYAGKGEPAPQIILVAPPLLCASDNADMMGHFGGLQHGLEQSSQFASHYARRAQEWETGFFDAATVAKADPRDG